MLHADDALELVTQPQGSVPALRIIDQFSHLLAYKVNWTKSKALPLTSSRPRVFFLPDDFCWPIKSGIKYFGIEFPHTLSDLILVNFEAVR